MKKTLLFFLLIIIFPLNVLSANKKDNVTLSACVDANSARFMLELKEIKVKFIGIDSQDSINFDNKDFSVSDYTCSLLKKAKNITLEYEEGLKEDQYGRIQAWVLIDNALLQENLVRNGYVKPIFIEKNYKYFNQVNEAEKNAKENNLGLWTATEEEKTIEEKVEKKKNFFEKIIDFIVDIFNKLINFIDKLIKEIF